MCSLFLYYAYIFFLISLYFGTLRSISSVQRMVRRVTPVSAKTAPHRVAMPKAPKIITTALTNSANVTFSATVNLTRRDNSTARARYFRLSPDMMTSAVSIAIPVPIVPMATPTSEAAMAGRR